MSDRAVAAFRRAEGAYWEALGIELEEREIHLPQTGTTARFLERGRGSPVLLVHGGGGLASGWGPLIPHLDGYRLILPDRPGFGLSEYVDYSGVDLRSHAVSFLRSILDAARVDKASIIANSMGALWSLWLAQADPSRVERLILMGTPARLLDTSAPTGMRLMGIPGLNRLMMALEPPSPKQVHRLWRRMGHDPERVCTPEMTDLVVHLERLPTYASAWLSLLENVLPFARTRGDVGFSADDLAGLLHPVMYVWGREDPFGALEVARAANELTPNSRLEVIGTGHLPWLDEPEACGRVARDFLNGGSNAQA